MRNIAYLMMPKTSKSDKQDRNIEEQEQDPTEDMSDDGDDRGSDGPGSTSHDPLYERKQCSLEYIMTSQRVLTVPLQLQRRWLLMLEAMR